jgi:plastocyanin
VTLSRRDLLRFGVGIVTSASLGGCTKGPQKGEAVIEMSGTTFMPGRIRVTAGTRVRWINTSDLQHTVTAYQEEIPDAATYFASGDAATEEAARQNMSRGLVGPQDTYEIALEASGTYRYFCIPHEGQGMTGTIVVEARPVAVGFAGHSA